jgi:hypothetical protein
VLLLFPNSGCLWQGLAGGDPNAAANSTNTFLAFGNPLVTGTPDTAAAFVVSTNQAWVQKGKEEVKAQASAMVLLKSVLCQMQDQNLS